MKRTATILTISVVTIALLVGSVELLRATRYRPSIVIHSSAKDVGLVRQGEKITQSFKIENRGKRTLVISDVESDCYCTSTPTTELQIPPGETKQFALTVDTSRLEGTVQREASLYTNDPYQSLVKVVINATVVPEFRLSAAAIDFGSIRAGRSATERLVLSLPAGGEHRVHVTGADSDASEVSIRLLPEGDHQLAVVATLSQAAQPGWWMSNVTVRSTSTAMPLFTIPVRAYIQK
jgi:hypothetical protein